MSALEDAVRDGDVEACRRGLATARIDVNQPRRGGNTLLHRACEKAELESIIPMLLAKGAVINASNDNGATPLHRAISAGHKGIAVLLVKQKADIDQLNQRGRSPLCYAYGELRQQLEELSLLEEGAPGIDRGAARSAVITIPRGAGRDSSDDGSRTDPVRHAVVPTIPAAVAEPTYTPGSASRTVEPAVDQPISAPVPTDLIVSVVQRVLRRLGRGPIEEPEEDRLARLRSHCVTLLGALDECGIEFTLGAAAVAAVTILDSRGQAGTSELGTILHDRVRCQGLIPRASGERS